MENLISDKEAQSTNSELAALKTKFNEIVLAFSPLSMQAKWILTTEFKVQNEKYMKFSTSETLLPPFESEFAGKSNWNGIRVSQSSTRATTRSALIGLVLGTAIAIVVGFVVTLLRDNSHLLKR